MTDPVLIALITALASVAAAGIGTVGVIVGVLNAQKIAKGRQEVAIVHDAVNGGLADAKNELKQSNLLLSAALEEIQSLKAAAKS